MASTLHSRWADTEEDTAVEAQRKREKELRKKAKAEKQRQLEEARKAQRSANIDPGVGDHGSKDDNGVNGTLERPSKRRRLSPEAEEAQTQRPTKNILRLSTVEWGPCRHVDNFEKLNHIEEGSYGWVSRARETATGEVVALKKLKVDNANDGFPVTGLREIQTLMESRHPNIVNLREVVIGDSLSE